MCISDATGQQLVNTLRPYPSKLPLRLELETVHHVFNTGQPATSSLLFDLVRQQHVISLEVPVWKDGRVHYALNFTTVPAEFLSAILKKQQLPPDWVVAFFDKQGKIAFRSHGAERFIGQKGAPALLARMAQVNEGMVETTTLEGIAVTSVFSRSDTSNWSVAIGIPTQSFTAELYRRFIWLAAAIVGLLGVGTLLALALAKRISGSVGALREPALALGKGEAVTLPPLYLKEAHEVGQALVTASNVLRRAEALRLESDTNLTATAHRLDAHLRNSPLALIEFDQNFHVQHWSAEAERLFGWSKEATLGWSKLDMRWVHEDDTEKVQRSWAELYSGACISNICSNRNYRRDGTVIDCEWYNTTLHDKDGNLVSVLSQVLDVSKRQQTEQKLRERETLLRTLTAHADIGMVMVTTEHRYVFANAAYAHLLGLPSADIVGQRMSDVLAPVYESQIRPRLDRAFGGERVAYELTQPPRRQGENEHILAVSYDRPIDTAQGPCVIVLVLDISERSRFEQETQAHAQTLVALDRRKDEFLAMLGHELRNPLAAIGNAAHLLRYQQNETPMQQQVRQVIERQVGQLKHLVDDLLEVSRITSGNVRLRKESTSIGGVVQRAVETVQPLIAQHRHALELSLPPQPLFLHADAARLEQVLVNLLTNAAKYTEDGGRIWLSVESESDKVVIKVRDNGIGMAPELLPHIFELFTQAYRSLERSQGGLGIGLSLVQQLVELHGGTVTADSVPGQGSEFVVRLPAMPLEQASALAPASQAPQPAGNESTGCRVLVVEDNVDVAQGLAKLLEMTGNEARVAYDGQSAVQAATDYRPDVVLLDIGLPGLDGYEVAALIRQQAALKGVVLVALTGYGQDIDRQRSHDAGFDYHLTKPTNFDDIEKILASIAPMVT